MDFILASCPIAISEKGGGGGGGGGGEEPFHIGVACDIDGSIDMSSHGDHNTCSKWVHTN